MTACLVPSPPVGALPGSAPRGDPGGWRGPHGQGAAHCSPWHPSCGSSHLLEGTAAPEVPPAMAGRKTTASTSPCLAGAGNRKRRELVWRGERVAWPFLALLSRSSWEKRKESLQGGATLVTQWDVPIAREKTRHLGLLPSQDGNQSQNTLLCPSVAMLSPDHLCFEYALTL